MNRTETTKTTNIVLLGIGGQGTLTMMEMLALTAEKADEEVRVLSRVSLARLGGSGMCHIRLGPSSSPAIPVGEADILVALEMSEVLRALPLARQSQGAIAFVNTYRRLSIAAGVAGIHYPTRAEVEQTLRRHSVKGIFIPASLPLSEDSGVEEGDVRINMLMLGVLCGYTNLLPRPLLEEAIRERVPYFAEQNLRTFEAGWRYAAALR